MTLISLHQSKRLPITMSALLLGVVFAGFVTRVIGTPRGTNDYLHEHLKSSISAPELIWAGDLLELPVEDRMKLSAIVTDVEKTNWDEVSETRLIGQALKVAKESHCQPSTMPCDYIFRLGREFSEGQIHQDLRVANIQEVSLRVSFKSEPDASVVGRVDIANETRLFRFYQTQNGWTQKTSEILETIPVEVGERSARLDANFMTNFVGVNYYPASASWRDFWTEFPIEEIRTDLETIRLMNANSVRIFLNHEYFDEADTQVEARAKLKVFLDLCADQNIQVLLTLFDLRPDYTLSNMDHDVDHIDKVLDGVFDHSAILGIDIKNQADLDFTTWGQNVVKGWLTVMARHIQTQYPDIPVTVGWSTSDAALGLQDVVDFVTYHEYGDPKGFSERLEAIKIKAGDKPVMITELGSTIWNPLRTTRSAELKQASRLKNQLEQSSAADGVFVWTLNDFEHVGSEVVGPRPWRKAQQRQFGLTRRDGSARPAKTVFQEHAKNRVTRSIN